MISAAVSYLALLTSLGCALTSVHVKNDTPPKFMAAYFRHSIKATGGGTHYTDKLTTEDDELVKKCPSGAKKTLDSCTEHMRKIFEAEDGHLTGNGKQVCPRAVGRLLRKIMGEKDIAFSMWSSTYERVVGTGIQTSYGLMGEDGISKLEMPKTTIQGWEVGTPKEFLNANLKGELSGWVKEYLHDFTFYDGKVATVAKEKCVDDCGPDKSCGKGVQLGDGKKWEQGTSGGCELSVYSVKAEQKGHECILDPDRVSKWEAGSEMHKLDKQLDASLAQGLTHILNPALLYNKRSAKSADTGLVPENFAFLKGDPNDCKGSGSGFSYQYADNVCRIGQHFTNERSADIPNADYKRIIRVCALGEEVKCDLVIDAMNDLCWPFFTKSHMAGHRGGFTDNSMSLLLGALAMRTKSLSANPDVEKAYEDMRRGAMLKTSGGHGGKSTDFKQHAVNDPATNNVLLMSSHDATTNGMRLIMMDAGLKVAQVNEWADGSIMQFTDELAYQVMLTFELDDSDNVKVQNLVQSLGTTRNGCERLTPDDNKSPLSLIGTYKVEVFLETIAVFLQKRNSVDGRKVVHPSVKKFLDVILHALK